MPSAAPAASCASPGSPHSDREGGSGRSVNHFRTRRERPTRGQSSSVADRPEAAPRRARPILCTASTTHSTGTASRARAQPRGVGHPPPSRSATGGTARKTTSSTSSTPTAHSSSGFPRRPVRTTGRVSLRHAKALASCPRTIAANAVPDAVASSAALRGLAPAPAAHRQHQHEGGQRHQRLGRAEHAERPQQHPPVGQRPHLHPPDHGPRGRLLGPQGEGRQQVGADVERQHLEHGQRRRDAARGQRPHEERRELGDVVGQVVGEEPADVRVGGPAQLDAPRRSSRSGRPGARRRRPPGRRRCRRRPSRCRCRPRAGPARR